MKTIKRILLLCLIVLIVVAGIQIKGGYDKYQNALEDRPLEQVIFELQSKENYTQYEDVPEIYYKALIAVEDRRFYKHNGFDRNNQSGVVTMKNCIADSNGEKNYNWPLTGKPSALGHEVTFGKAIIDSCISKNGKNNISGATLTGTCEGF